MNAAQQRRFWQRVHVAGADECWEWLGRRNPKGYGSIDIGARGSRRAHRVAYELTRGRIPEGQLVCHRCDNPGCVNPRHLFIGTPADNMADMIGKGRAKAPVPKLIIEDVHRIREMLKSGLSQTRIADAFGVNQTHVSRIARGVAWKHIPITAGNQED